MENLIEDKSPEIRETDLREQIFIYLNHWPWFVLSLIITIGLAYLYLRYEPNIYNTKATILIKDEGNRAASELAAFQDIGVASGLSASGFENEMFILKSNSLTERVVRKLNLNIVYTSEGSIRNTELYNNRPFTVRTVTSDSGSVPSFRPFYVLPISGTKFQLWHEDDEERMEYNFGDIISLSSGDIQITSNRKGRFNSDPNFPPIKVSIRSIPSTVARFRRTVGVDHVGQRASVIQLSINAENTDKSEAILNEIINQYNEDAIADRSMVTKNTADFIQGRLKIISEELDSVETGKVDFKQSHKIIDLATEGQIVLMKEGEFMRSLLDVGIQLELVNMTTEYLRNAGEHDLIPANLGVESQGLMTSIEGYNQIILERSRLLASSTEKNPSVILLNDQLREMKANIFEGLRSMKNTLEVRKNDILEQSSRVDSDIVAAPPKEKLFRSIVRQQELKEALYLYLLQKREENAISKAVTAPKAKVVDYAYSSLAPISPNRQMIMLIGLTLGLVIPFSIIYLSLLLDNKIRNKSQFEMAGITAPIIGELPKIRKDEEELIRLNDRSILAESFRIMSANLQYLFVGKPKDNGRVVLVTSTVKGEGKTFISANLAITLANSGSSVILVGGDLRNPQIHRYLAVDKSRDKAGVVEYLLHPEKPLDEFIIESEAYENLSLMFSGTIPPNPAELLMTERVSVLFKDLKARYDYVIVDTAPSMLVADTFLLSDYADSTIYVSRVGYTPKNLLSFVKDKIKQKKLENVAIAINNLDVENLGYGSKYGYSYSYSYGYGSSTRRTLWRRIKDSF